MYKFEIGDHVIKRGWPHYDGVVCRVSNHGGAFGYPVWVQPYRKSMPEFFAYDEELKFADSDGKMKAAARVIEKWDLWNRDPRELKRIERRIVLMQLKEAIE
jgi:hypothetical protein